MRCLDRYEEYKDFDFDRIILHIRNGTIKSGRYSHLVKVDNNKIIKSKTLFKSKESDNIKSSKGE